MLGIPIGLAFANVTEWVMHKYVLHGLGKNPKSFWSFHWHEHHRAARKNGHLDEAYQGSLLHWNGQTKEALALVVGALAFVPLLPVAPFFVGTVWYSSLNYYRKHKRAHLDPEWARQHLPWHYDHHMGPEPDSNWCVTRPWMDSVMGTRHAFLGTAREVASRARRAARTVARAA